VSTTDRHLYRFLPRLRLALIGDGEAVRHFDREYGTNLEPGGEDANVIVQIDGASGPGLATRRGTVTTRGGHKSVHWKVTLGDPGVLPLIAAISLSGWPRSFGLSLIQGYFVEGLVSLAAPAAGHVLLPAAAIALKGQATLLLGPSGTGKSSVSARMMTAGAVVIGDDQVFIDRGGRCTSFPRRMRFYPDLAETAPDAFRALAPRTRLRLRSRGLLDRMTAGQVRPSLAVDPVELDSAHELRTATIHRVLVLERGAHEQQLERRPDDQVSALAAARRVFELQRARLWAISPPDWRSLINETAEVEQRILSVAFRKAKVERVRIPAGWPPKQAVAALTAMVDGAAG
jgi:hypothetical protein